MSNPTKQERCPKCNAATSVPRPGGCSYCVPDSLTSKERTLLLEGTGESRDADYEVVLRFNRAVTEAEYRAIHEHMKLLTGQSAPETRAYRHKDCICEHPCDLTIPGGHHNRACPLRDSRRYAQETTSNEANATSSGVESRSPTPRGTLPNSLGASSGKAPDDDDCYRHGPGTFPQSDGCLCAKCAPNGKGDGV